MATKYQIEPQRLLETLKNTVIKATKNHTPTNEEIAAFVMVANEYGLNPFTKEIHAFASQGGIVPIVGVDGWVRIVNRRDEFDGCSFQEEHDENRNPVSTTCTMFVKGRGHAIEVTEWFVECKRPTVPWQTMPRRMLRHKAYIQAARICFGLSGIYDEDEARDILRQAKDTGEPNEPPVGRRINLRQMPSPREQEIQKASMVLAGQTIRDEPYLDLEEPPEESTASPPAKAPAREPAPADSPSVTEPPDVLRLDQWAARLAMEMDDNIDGTRNPKELLKILEDLDQHQEALGPEYERLKGKVVKKLEDVEHHMSTQGRKR